jgi:hypothetical protein
MDALLENADKLMAENIGEIGVDPYPVYGVAAATDAERKSEYLAFRAGCIREALDDVGDPSDPHGLREGVRVSNQAAGRRPIR